VISARSIRLRQFAQDLPDEILTWANRGGAIQPEGSLSLAGGSQVQPWIDFLLHFDVEFRRRRLSFVMRGLNLLYSRLEEASFKEVKPGQIDDLKSRFQSPPGAIAQAGKLAISPAWPCEPAS